MAETLRSRLLLSFAGVTLLMTMGFTLLVWMSHQAGLENATQRLLLSEGEALLRDPDRPLPQGGFLQGHRGEEALPPRIRDHLDHFEPEDDGAGLWEWREIHMWRHDPPGGQAPLFLVVDLGVSVADVFREANTLRSLLLGALLLFGGILLFSVFLNRRLVRPVEKLTARISAIRPNDPLVRLAGDFRQGETAQIARAFDAQHQRALAFLERERRFTRNASHELRTPVTLVRSALSVLRGSLPVPSPKQGRALGHLQRAADEMTTTIETFLRLAREEESAPADSGMPASEVLRNCVELHKPLLPPSAPGIVLELREEPQPPPPADLLHIAAGNLVRNACQHAAEGRIEVLLFREGLRVLDHGPGLGSGGDPSRAGLGLRITREIAERGGWELRFTETPGGGTTAHLQWDAPES